VIVLVRRRDAFMSSAMVRFADACREVYADRKTVRVCGRELRAMPTRVLLCDDHARLRALLADERGSRSSAKQGKR
jgi:hypothetical protein